MGMLTKEEIDRLAEGRTIVSEFLSTVAACGDRTALRWMDGDDWRSMTFTELADHAARAAAGFRALGVGNGDRVVLMMRNTPEFHWLDIGALMCGATPVSIYNSSAPDQIEYLVTHSEAKLAVVEDQGFLDSFLKVRDDLPSLQDIVVVKAGDDLPEGVHPLGVLTDQDPVDMDEAASIAKPEDLATIIYTSGTTGSPKGVMISHHNVVWTSESLLTALDWTREQAAGKRVVSYLPMAHIAERMVSHYLALGAGFEVSTCPDTSLLTTFLGQVHPNFMFGVPRVFEKVYAGVTAVLSGDPEKAEKFNEAIAAGQPIREKMTWGTATEEEIATYEFLDAVAFSQVRDLLGLDQLDLAVSGAAPIPPELITWFRTIGVPLAEIYGMSESCGPMTFAPYKVKAGSVGPTIPGTEIKLAEDGELCQRGGNIFVGYLNEPEKTAEALDEDGWLHSGDIAEIDEDGYVRIVDRKKELIITAGGKNVSPANLEAALKMIPIVGQAAAIGDNRPFVSALLVLDPEVAPVWAQNEGIEFTDLEDLAGKAEVRAEIERCLGEVMADFNNAERVKKFHVLGEEWLPDSEMLTPTSKLKRRGVHQRYAEEIEGLYS
jgi:long-chain acyl-CoA synthetase